MNDRRAGHHPAEEGKSPDAPAYLTLGHVLAAIGAEHDPPIGLDDIRVIRHSFNTGEELGLRGPEDLTEDKVRSYTRFHGISPRQFPVQPERYWVVLIADGQRRSRLWGAFENRGEIVAGRTARGNGFASRAHRQQSLTSPRTDPPSSRWRALRARRLHQVVAHTAGCDGRAAPRSDLGGRPGRTARRLGPGTEINGARNAVKQSRRKR